jgi:hypothetical protein
MSEVICPVCLKPVNPSHFACVRARDMGRMSSPAKTASCKRNILKRWEGHAEEKARKKAAEEKDIKENIALYYKKHFKSI